MDKALQRRQRAHIYVIIMHEPSGRWYALDRSYGLLRGIQGNREDFVKLTDEHALSDAGESATRPRMVDSWEGWTPTEASQMPEWARGSDFKRGWTARWYEGDKHDPKGDRGFEVEALDDIGGYGVIIQQVLTSSRWYKDGEKFRYRS